MARGICGSWWGTKLWMNGRQTTFSPRRKLEAIPRRGGAFVDWHCAWETRFASWEVPTGKSMLHWTTSRFAPHRTEVIHYERGSGILVTDRSLNWAQHSRGSILLHRILPFFARPSSQRRAVAASGLSPWLFRNSRRVWAASSYRPTAVSDCATRSSIWGAFPLDSVSASWEIFSA